MDRQFHSCVGQGAGVKKVVLQRDVSLDEGTFGVITLPDGWSCYTLELPWRDNRRRASCIPAGVYRAVDHVSPRFGRTYWIRDVPGRDGILIHAGNLAGDREKGRRSDSDGCILLGMRKGQLQRQAAVLDSKTALREFLSRMAHAPFILDVRNA